MTELLDTGLKPFKLFAEDSKDVKSLGHVDLVSKTVLKRMSSLVNPNGILGVFHIPDERQIDANDWIVALDAVRDPGNLGTIIRLCDWFGVEQLICSLDTVDCYSPKVQQATMGSIARVNITYLDLPEFLKTTELPVYGTFMDGEAVYTKKLPPKGVLVMGFEGNGISEDIKSSIQERITIPQFGKTTTESLNVATATAIFLNEIRRGCK